MEVNIPEPNEALGAFMVSSRCNEILHDIGDTRIHPLYESIVAKRTGRLAASGIFHTEIGGVRHDRLVGTFTIGSGLDYGLAHEFGAGDHPQSVHNLDGPNQIHAAAHDLNRVLEELGGA